MNAPRATLKMSFFYGIILSGFIFIVSPFSTLGHAQSEEEQIGNADQKAKELLKAARSFHDQQKTEKALNAAEAAYHLVPHIKDRDLQKRISQDWKFYTRIFQNSSAGEGDGKQESTTNSLKEFSKDARHSANESEAEVPEKLPSEKVREEFRENIKRETSSVHRTLEHNIKISPSRARKGFRRLWGLWDKKGDQFYGHLNRKLQITHRHFGPVNPYYMSSLFYMPTAREAYSLQQRKVYMELNFLSAGSKKDDINNEFTSQVDTEYRKFTLGGHYGLTDRIDIGLRGGFGQVDGTPTLIDNKANIHLIGSGKSGFSFDDIDFEISYLPSTTWAQNLLSFYSPFGSFAYESNQTLTFAIKMPTGDTDNFLSSGSFDYALSMRSSHSFGVRPMYLDSGLHIIIPGNIDNSLYSGAVEETPFLMLDYTFSRLFFENMLAYASVTYNTSLIKEMKTAFTNPDRFDIYENDGVGFKFGAKYYKDIWEAMLIPSATFYIRNGDNFGAQISSDVRF